MGQMEAQQIEALQSTTYKAELNNDMKDATPTLTEPWRSPADLEQQWTVEEMIYEGSAAFA